MQRDMACKKVAAYDFITIARTTAAHSTGLLEYAQCNNLLIQMKFPG